MTQNAATNHVDDAGSHQRGCQDKQAQDHDYRVTAEPGKRAVRRQQAGKDKGQEQTERGDLRLCPLRREKHESYRNETEKKSDLQVHSTTSETPEFKEELKRTL